MLLRITGKKSFIRLSHYFPPTQTSSPHSPSSVSCICRVESERASLVPGAAAWRKKKLSSLSAALIHRSLFKVVLRSCETFSVCAQMSRKVGGRREESGRRPLCRRMSVISGRKIKKEKEGLSFCSPFVTCDKKRVIGSRWGSFGVFLFKSSLQP